MHLRTHIHGLGLMMIATGILYPFDARFSVPAVLLSWLGAYGYVLFCLSLFVCGVGLIAFQNHFMIWIAPLVVIWLASIHVTVNGSHTALVFYTPLLIFPIYQHYKSRVVFKRLTTRRLFIPLYLCMVFILLIKPESSGLPIIYNMLSVWSFNLIDPVLIYKMIYMITFAVLIAQEFTSYLPGDRLITQFVSLPFILHGLIFALYIFSVNGAIGLIPFLVAVPLLYWGMTRNYSYG